MQTYCKSRLMNPAFLNYCLDHCYSQYKMTFKLEFTTNLEMFSSKKQKYIIKFNTNNFFYIISLLNGSIFFFDFLNFFKKHFNEKYLILITFLKKAKKKQQKIIRKPWYWSWVYRNSFYDSLPFVLVSFRKYIWNLGS